MMKKFNKIISLLLAVIMMLGSLTAFMAIGVAAEEATEDTEDTGDELAGIISSKKPEDYTEKLYVTEDQKLATMTLAFRNKGYSIYVDDYSGEVAIVNEATGEKLFTNPWDVAADKSSNDTTDDSTTGSIKEQLLSQIEIAFTDATTGLAYTYSSFRMASMRDQIVIKNIKNGIRVEYTIGREQTKMLVPQRIEATRFNELIKPNIIEGMQTLDNAEFYINKFLVFFQPVSKYQINDEGEFILDPVTQEKIMKSDAELKQLYEDFPALKNYDLIYALSPEEGQDKIPEAILMSLESSIKTYCSDYTYEELDYDHDMMKFEAEDENPPVFKMALEYTIDDQGLTVRLPANGIRFNESLYTLNSITVLPYMGAGSNWCEGYNFMPDGSGALYDFDTSDVKKTPIGVYQQVYGTDYAYHELSGTYEKTIRYPVFGTVEKSYEATYYDIDGKATTLDSTIIDKVLSHDPEGKDTKYKDMYVLYNPIIKSESDKDIVEKKSGFLAIIEEGDALTRIASYHGGNQTDYNSVKMQFTPRPSDSYNLQESISVSGLGEWTVVSDRKYLGNYKMRYIMLSDGDAAAADGKDVYDASWLGMAAAYRDYLTTNGILSPLSDDEISENIPLYIESFGALETVERILSVPVDRMTALTTFENVMTMYDELSDEGIDNVNFKLTGFANGGMYYTVPKNIKFERVVGGKKGFQALLDYAADKAEDGEHLGIFPDFDFAYIINEGMFDGLSLRKHAAKTIDDRYASKRVYSATQQKYVNYYDLVVSPAYFSEFYEKLVDKYLDYDNLNGISVGSLGNALNSDFDEDEPYNREDSKKDTIEAFEYLKDNLCGLEIMTSGGNAYTWKYVDHILDVALDSSRQSRASESVPFIGVVLHGSVQFAGEPLNMEGDLQYAMLKAIENGASPYFVLSYQNTDNLKEDEYLSKYYSIRYDIWKKDLISTYNTLNDVLGDVQDKYIIDHDFITGDRIPDIDEIEADILAAMQEYIDSKNNLIENELKAIEQALANAREEGRVAEAAALAKVVDAIAKYASIEVNYNNIMLDTVDGEGNVSHGLLTKWKNAQDAKEKTKLWYDIEDQFTVLSGQSYRDLRAIVTAIEAYVNSTAAAVETIKTHTDNAYMINQAEQKAELVSRYYNNDRLVLTAPVDTLNGKKITLLPEDQWINGLPTYSYGLVNENYVYVVGDLKNGFKGYTYSESGSVMPLVGNIGNGSGEELIGEAVDLSELDVYLDGTAVDKDGLVIYKTEDGRYFSELEDAYGTVYYIYYSYQQSYKSMLEDANAWIDSVLDAVSSDADAKAALDGIYANSMSITDNVDDDDDEGDEDESKYIVGNLVIVTYGEGNEAYKYVILNYNNFSVKVEFDGIEYTIPGYDFVDVLA